MKLQTETLVVLGAIVVVSIGAVYLARKASGGLIDAAGTVGTAINPLSDQNVFYKAAGAVGDMIGGGASQPLGSRIWEALNPGAVAAEKALLGGTTVNSGGAAPANDLRQIDRIIERAMGPQSLDSGPQYDALGNYIGSY